MTRSYGVRPQVAGSRGYHFVNFFVNLASPCSYSLPEQADIKAWQMYYLQDSIMILRNCKLFRPNA